jgi:hypothetical protein
MRLFAWLRRLPSRLRLVVRQFPKAYTGLDKIFKLRREYQEPETWRKARLQLVPLEPRLVPGRLQGEVWYDSDGIGTINPGEPAATGVAVTISGGGLATPETATTDGSGLYCLASLTDGDWYTVTFASVPGYAYEAPIDADSGQYTL